MNREPGRLLDRLVGACFNVLLGALTLYGAVWLLAQVWTELVVIGGLVGSIVIAVAVWRFRQSRW